MQPLPLLSSGTLLFLALVADAAGDLAPTGLVWMAPFFSGGGYCSEAIDTVLALKRVINGNITWPLGPQHHHTWFRNLSIGIVQHGDQYNPSFMEGLEESVREQLSDMVHQAKRLKTSTSIVVCHSEPGAWYPPNYPTTDCPPKTGALIRIGRTMFETDRLPDKWEERLNKMDSIWVPTEFHQRIFEAGGVDASKIVIVPEAIDTSVFDPDRVDALTLPSSRHTNPFIFLSIFKFEERKGWKFLLEAYWKEFKVNDAVRLVILTSAYHSDSNFEKRISDFAREIGLGSDITKLAEVTILKPGMKAEDMPRLYKAADAFVICSRGEGWGRPHVESMSMGLPLIATRWSGPEEYMRDDNSFPIRIEGLEEIREGPFKGHRWAKPSVKHIQELMRTVITNPVESQRRGSLARKHMMDHYCMECIARLVLHHLDQILRTRNSRHREIREEL